ECHLFDMIWIAKENRLANPPVLSGGNHSGIEFFNNLRRFCSNYWQQFQFKYLPVPIPFAKAQSPVDLSLYQPEHVLPALPEAKKLHISLKAEHMRMTNEVFQQFMGQPLGHLQPFFSMQDQSINLSGV